MGWKREPLRAGLGLQAASLVPKQTELATACITLWWPLGPERGGILAAQRGNSSQLPLPEIRLLRKRRKQGPFDAGGMGRRTERTCDRAIGIRGWKSSGQVGLTSQTPAGPASDPGCPCCWHAAEPGAGTAWDVSHCPTWPEQRFPEDICASAAPAPGMGCGSGFPMLRALCIWLFSFHCCSGQASRSSFHFIKRASAPPPASLRTVLGKSAVTGVTGRTGATTAPFYLKPLQLPPV